MALLSKGSPPTLPEHLSTKEYVDTQLSRLLVEKFTSVPADFINTGASSAARLIGNLPTSVVDYDRYMDLTGTATIYVPTFSSGIQEVRLAVSAMASTVASVQAESIVSWIPASGGTWQTGTVFVKNLLIPADTPAIARMWIRNSLGSLPTTITTDAKLSRMYAEFTPVTLS